MDITDASNYPGHADQLFTPETESEVAAILQRAMNAAAPSSPGNAAAEYASP
jgi:hypothetical protein